MKILVSGATGYVGRRLIPRLVASSHDVTCMVRKISREASRASESCRLVVADALEPQGLAAAMQGIDVAYYLIHSMAAPGGDFQQRDLSAAKNFANAARQAEISRIIYLGGLASSTSEISKHLKSRQETGEVLREFGPAVTEFRAGIIVGNGSVSFELIRCLTERLPVMICPRWVITRTQPIAIEDVLSYLIAALESPESTGQIIEIGGATIETYRSMMLIYARIRGLRRWLLRVSVLTPRLSSYWLRLVTPIPSSIARPLIEGLRTEVVCTSTRAAELFPAICPIGYAAAVERTLRRALPDKLLRESVPGRTGHFFIRREGVLCDVRQAAAEASPQKLFSVITQLGGSNGYLYANFLWRIRGAVDRLLGGVGMRPRPGHGLMMKDDRFDFWHVEDVEADRRLLLRAEMKLPGRAWLEFLLIPKPDGITLLCCYAWFEPRGSFGELYWWLLYPIHFLLFRGLVGAVCAEGTGSVTLAGGGKSEGAV